MNKFPPREGRPFDIEHIKPRHKSLRVLLLAVTGVILPLAISVAANAVWNVFAHEHSASEKACN